MAQSYDVSLKALFLGEGDGIIRRLLFGGKVTEFLTTEQPQVSNRRVDLLARTEDGEIHHVEFQAANEPGFPLRMLDYYSYLVRTHGRHVTQIVLYLGREPMRLENRFQSPSMDFRFEIVNLREFPAAPLLASQDWADNALALLADGEPERALQVVTRRIAAMPAEERRVAEATILLFSGIIGMEETISSRIREVGMIDVMQNKVLGPLIRQSLEQAAQEGRNEGRNEGLNEGLNEGRKEGIQQGRAEAMFLVVYDLFTEKFGAVPAWAAQRLAAGNAEELRVWAKRLLTAPSVEEALR